MCPFGGKEIFKVLSDIFVPCHIHICFKVKEELSRYLW